MKRPISVAIGLFPVIMLVATACALGDANSSIVNTPHNLSASGTGRLHSPNEQQICIFCHTPHNSQPIQPLWNRNMSPDAAYIPYSSPTLVSHPGSPTGSSKLCLSCHDGTIAVGSIASRTQPISMTLSNTIPAGTTNLGTNLSDDHPVSFPYDVALFTQNTQLVDPRNLPSNVKLDNQNQLQCDTCHDPHDDSKGNFLVMDNTTSQLCNTCHVPNSSMMVQGHNQCSDCHQQHLAPSGAYLLRADTITDTCTLCHTDSIPASTMIPGSSTTQPVTAIGGATADTAPPPTATPMLITRAFAPTAQASSISADLRKTSRHEAETRVTLFAIGKKPTNTVNCADCHEPHTMRKTQISAAPLLQGTLGRVSGVTAAGAKVKTARFEYEVCFKCHGDNASDRPYINRKIVQTNLRLAFDRSAVSFHPIERAGRNTRVPSLAPNYTTSSLIYCTDCHGSDTSRKAGGAGPAGPHGSENRPLLVARYETMDGISESPSAYALCYKCHQRVSILRNESFPQHRSHIVNDRASCSICHDSHGIATAQGTTVNNSNLINFDTSIVRPDPITKRLEYRTLGPGRGECYLLCHGKAHSPLKY